MRPFVYEALPARVIFGFGTKALLAEEVARLGCSRALILSTPQQATTAENLATILGESAVGIFSGAKMHTPVAITNEALRIVADKKVDCVVALGGGSTIGLGKAIALNTDIPQIAIPTTYAGSEATPILGQTDETTKTTLRSLKVLPETIIYDVEFSLTLPYAMTVTSGINAIAHAAEALYAKERNPVVSRMAEDGIRAIANALRTLQGDISNHEARADALYGAWSCGTCLGSVGMALHHKICHELGGALNLPHSETHTVILPHALAYNAPAEPEVMTQIAAAIGKADAASGLFDLIGEFGGPLSLKELGMQEQQIDHVVDQLLARPYWNPRPLEAGALRSLLQKAFNGDRP